MEAGHVVVLFLLGISSFVAPVRHSLKYLSKSSTEVPNLTEFVAAYEVDGVQIIHYDSNTTRAVPTQDWMIDIVDNDPKFWKKLTETMKRNQQDSKESLEIMKWLFNQTGGPHIGQVTAGCEWDDETGEVNRFDKYSYDREDFLWLDPKTNTWICPRLQGVFTKRKLNHKKAQLTRHKADFLRDCPDLLKIFLNYRKLISEEIPSVSLLQKTPSSPVTCRATGFYPHRAELFWTKDGKELNEGVVKGEILPNQDGTFQMSADLDLFLVEEDDWWRYSCVFRLAGAQQEIVTKLDKRAILTDNGDGIGRIIAIVIGVFVVLPLKVGCVFGRYYLWNAICRGYRRTDG
ncbi:class I histocompatibility antigen, F10 alpha chain-like isoform X2 [Salarias fasciatus]|uniref:Class I histocompatibility antigen, F10 alpha chain-like n=1 Tax=Salarias fasciatus TaxID=181472 RepID=A0A672JQD5_SALFA|nr:class I histocompatibility antigen, F10 alpha chain-like isoform X1 [Salarias fasciatus]XP_029940597.1 class I histocompatibility antigen, F10 alpha chain-like isoform X2 [Salarias fasciatus]